MLLISMMLVLGFSLNVYASESSSTITIETQEENRTIITPCHLHIYELMRKKCSLKTKPI